MTPKKLIIGFGVVFCVVCGGLLIWSLFRPPVTRGPEPPDPWAKSARDAGRG